jgi:4-amino-4-deoxy-L-arabinose transferase-like glycosyltransferase
MSAPATHMRTDGTDERLRRAVLTWLFTHERSLLVAILLIGTMLRVWLVAFSPTSFGYVWDFYHEGVRLLWRDGRLPASTACWQCYHPPLFYILGWPLYAFGRWTARTQDADAQGLRWLAGLATASAGLTIYYGYRLLRLFGCRGGSVVIGVAILVTFPCLFFSSYGAEADIVLTAILSAFIYYLTRDFAARAAVGSSLRLGVLAGLAAATKYSGLVAVVSVVILSAVRFTRRRGGLTTVAHAAIILAVTGSVGGWKYVDNYRHYGTPLYANGTAQQGFAIERSGRRAERYEFTSFRLGDVVRLYSPHSLQGPLTDLPVYRSVPTTLHALAWSDMSFFSEPSRHGDPSHPYPRKHVPTWLVGTVIVLGVVPELLAITGFVVTLRRRIFLPLIVISVVAGFAYLWWFLGQDAWALKTKYLLFLLPIFVVYTVSGAAYVWKRVPPLGVVAGVLLTVLVGVTTVYLFAFDLG